MYLKFNTLHEIESLIQLQKKNKQPFLWHNISGYKCLIFSSYTMYSMNASYIYTHEVPFERNIALAAPFVKPVSFKV